MKSKRPELQEENAEILGIPLNTLPAWTEEALRYSTNR